MNNTRHFITWVLGLVIAFQISQTFAGTDVPVLIWGGNLPTSSNHLVNPFEKTSQRGFEKILTKIMGGSLNPVLVFVKDDLCVEDMIKHKEILETLMNMGSVLYRPAVDTPVSVFENLPSYNFTTEDEPETLSEAQLVVKNVTDLDSVSKTFKIMKKSSPSLVAALTGRSCRYLRSERIKRAAGDDPTPSPNPPFFVNTSRILMYSSSVPELSFSEDEAITVDLANYTQEGEGTGESPLQLNFEYTVKNGTTAYSTNILLQFPVKSGGYYSPEVLYKRGDENVTLKTNPSLDLSFPFNFSYHCSNNVTFNNATFIRFNIKDFQVQIDGDDFGDAYDCVGFMSIPIWAGIFVTTILAIIMTWGLTMIMDIRTMDRFDDPKGKTITISASTE